MLAFAPPLTHATSDSHSSATALRPRSTSRVPSSVSTSVSSSSSIVTSNLSLHRAPSKPSFPTRSSGHRRAESSSTRAIDQNTYPDRPQVTSYTNHTPAKQRVVHSPLEKLREQDAGKLLQLLASLLQQIAIANDRLRTSQSQSNDEPINQSHERAASPVHRPPIWSTLTSASREAFSTTSSCLTFHARNIPTISLEAYLLRILKYCPTTNEVFLSLLVYFDRMSKLAFDVTGKTFAIDSYNVHRLVIAGVTVASKFFSDVFYTNSRYAKVGGLPQTELNQLELQFLLLNNFRLSIGVEEFQRYADQLQVYAQNTAAGVEPKALNSDSDIYARSPQDLISTSIRQMGASADSLTRDSVTAHDVIQDFRPKVNGSSRGSVETHSRVSQSSENPETEDEDGETDDEPTIRGHSSAGSETQSLCTTESEEAYSEADDIDDSDHRTPEHSATMSPMSP